MSDEQTPTIEGTKLSALACNLESFSQLPPSVANKLSLVTEAALQFNALVGSSLEGLEAFTSLETLMMDNNDIETLRSLPPMPNLHTLWLNNNSVAALDDIVLPLAKQCPRLSYLSLLRNPCCPNELMGKGEQEYRRYRLYVKYRIPTLKMLDMAPFTPEEAKEAKEKGQFMATATVAKPAAPATAGSSNDLPNAASSGKLDEAAKTNQDEEGDANDNEPDYFKNILEKEAAKQSGPYFTQQRHFYSGKASEGNRFIKDDVL